MKKEFVVWYYESSSDEFTVHTEGKVVLHYLNGVTTRVEGASDEDFAGACKAVEDRLKELEREAR